MVLYAGTNIEYVILLDTYFEVYSDNDIALYSKNNFAIRSPSDCAEHSPSDCAEHFNSDFTQLVLTVVMFINSHVTFLSSDST